MIFLREFTLKVQGKGQENGLRCGCRASLYHGFCPCRPRLTAPVDAPFNACQSLFMLKCSHCDGTLESGKLVAQYATRFQPDATHRRFFSFDSDMAEVQALMCQACGRIELRGDTEKLRTLLKR